MKFHNTVQHACISADGFSCGFSQDEFDDTGLSVDTRETMDSYTEQLIDGHCRIKYFYGAGQGFHLTQKDIELLAECDLNYLHLSYTACFSGIVDLSGLDTLIGLFMTHCTNLNFTITGLPATIEQIDIRGLNIDNINVGEKDSLVGNSLELVEISNPIICSCPQPILKMFGNPMPEQARCGLSETIYPATNLHQMHAGFVLNSFNSAISSCDNLIENPVLRALLWAMALFATIGNAAVILSYSIFDKKGRGKARTLYPINLACSDLLMGVYLFIIAAADGSFRGEYVLHDSRWREDTLCHFAGFLSTLASETSAMFILLITLDRYLVIRFPFGEFHSSSTTLKVACGTAWLIGATVASLPLLVPHWEVYSFNSICVGLPLNSDTYHGSGYAVGIFIGANTVIFFLIAVGQVSIYRVKSASSAKLNLQGEQAKRRYREDRAVARQLSLIVVTDFLCWFPICIMGLMSQTGFPVSNSAYAWSAVVVLPINSALNPLLYTLRHTLTAGFQKCRDMVKSSSSKGSGH